MVKFAEHYYLVQHEMSDDACVEISPTMRNMNSTPKNIHVLTIRQYKNEYTPTHVHPHTLTHTLTHLNTSVFAGTIPMPSPHNDPNTQACYEGWRLA